MISRITKRGRKYYKQNLLVNNKVVTLVAFDYLDLMTMLLRYKK